MKWCLMNDTLFLCTPVLVAHTPSAKKKKLQCNSKYTFSRNYYSHTFCAYDSRSSMVAFAANLRDLRVSAQLFVAQLPPLHPTQPPPVCNEPFPSERDSFGAMRHACGRSIAATEPLQLCRAHRSTTLNTRTRASSNASADPTMLSSLAAATQVAKPQPQQLDPAHEQPS
jgi:hypothetical protein